jgi:hypothetical protein
MLATSKGVRLSNGSNLEVIKTKASKVRAHSSNGGNLLDLRLTSSLFCAEADNEASTAFCTWILPFRFVSVGAR